MPLKINATTRFGELKFSRRLKTSCGLGVFAMALALAGDCSASASIRAAFKETRSLNYPVFRAFSPASASVSGELPHAYRRFLSASAPRLLERRRVSVIAPPPEFYEFKDLMERREVVAEFADFALNFAKTHNAITDVEPLYDVQGAAGEEIFRFAFECKRKDASDFTLLIVNYRAFDSIRYDRLRVGEVDELVNTAKGDLKDKPKKELYSIEIGDRFPPWMGSFSNPFAMTTFPFSTRDLREERVEPLSLLKGLADETVYYHWMKRTFVYLKAFPKTAKTHDLPRALLALFSERR